MKIYVVRAKGVGVKIGASANMKRRLPELQCGSGKKLEIIAEIECDNARSVEHKAHQLLRNKRLSGEWFSVRPERAVATVNKAIALLSAPKSFKETSRESRSLAMSHDQRAALDAYARKVKRSYVDAIMHAIGADV